MDPANRLVAAELERRWNDRLAAVQQQEERLAALAAAQPESLSPVETDRLMNLGADLETVWNHPSASAETRKRILRTVLEEIVVTLAEGRIELLLHPAARSTSPLPSRRPTRMASAPSPLETTTLRSTSIAIVLLSGVPRW